MAHKQDYLRKLRGIGHELKPILQLGQRGLTDSVVEEIHRALNDHELIKIRLTGVERDEKKELLSTLESRLNASVIHAVGHMALLLRPNPEAKPKLSNLKRHGL